MHRTDIQLSCYKSIILVIHTFHPRPSLHFFVFICVKVTDHTGPNYVCKSINFYKCNLFSLMHSIAYSNNPEAAIARCST